MKDIAIMVVAQNISDEIKHRYAECVSKSKPNCSWDIHFLSSDDPSQKINFNKSKLLNSGIKNLYNKGYKVIIQSDIDLITPPGIVDKSLEIGLNLKTCFYNFHYRIDPRHLPKLPDDYQTIDFKLLSKTFASENANGCWNAMTPESWMASGGYNEYMIEWGREDDVFRSNAGNKFGIKFINFNQFCLIHVNHPPRTKDMRKYNRSMEEKARKEGKTNWLI
jgi:hypothetical protein